MNAHPVWRIVQVFQFSGRRAIGPGLICVVFLVYRKGTSRGFAFVRYKYADEAEKAIKRVDGKA
jgi:hypothetical protein